MAENPKQMLLHLTSRGSRVRSLVAGGTRFTNMTQQPINDVNRFGLLHYSIPKIMDYLSDENRTFTMRIRFKAGNPVDIPVTLPQLDYYSTTVDSLGDATLCLTEILQSAINFAIVKYWTDNGWDSPVLTHRGHACLYRIGCIVQMTPDGRLRFVVGYKGKRVTELLPETDFYQWAPVDGVLANVVLESSGTPVTCAGDAPEVHRGFPGIATTSVDHLAYQFIATNGNPFNHTPPPGSSPAAERDSAMITAVEMHGLSRRLQMMFGAASDIALNHSAEHGLREEVSNGEDVPLQAADALYRQRGRIILVNYRMLPTNDRTGLVNVTMPLPPNLYAPSFMLKGLTAQGTRSKVLGHDAERAGWAIPTSSNQFKSKYNNFPGVENGPWTYSPYDVRQPAGLLNMSPLDREDKVKGDGTYKDWLAHDGALGPQFDQIPWDPTSVVYEAPGDAWNVLEIDNYSLVPAPDAHLDHYNAGHKLGSRMLHFGDPLTQTAQGHKAPRSSRQFGLTGESMTEAPTFTVSMIDPNWIYTDVPNSTVQSIDVVIMWGDTSENVSGSSAYPVQVTLVAGQ